VVKIIVLLDLHPEYSACLDPGQY